MKALIVSDIHGGYDNLKKIIDRNLDFDYLICCGDFLSYGSSSYDDVKVLNEYNKKIIAVCGNCDHFKDGVLDFSLNDYVVFPLDGNVIFMTHGHRYNRNSFPSLEYDIYIQGHTHVPLMEKENNILYLNPGSISYPRGGSKSSYILYQDSVFYLKSVEDDSVIKKIKID